MRRDLHVAFGNKEHLLRSFSEAPERQAVDWATSLKTRSVTLAPPVALAVVGYGLFGQGWQWSLVFPCLCWIVGQVLLQSLDVTVLFHKRFRRQIAVELMGTAVTLGMLLQWLPHVSATEVVWLLAVVTAGKAVVLRLWMADVLPHVKSEVDSSLLHRSVAFFLLGLTGLLGSRIDMYCVAGQLGDGEVARYQVLMNMLLYLQALANLILLPFLRDVYGMKLSTIRALALRFLGLGAVLSAVGVGAVWAVMTWGYALPVSGELLAYGYGYAAQIYLALPLIYGLYKAGDEMTVLQVNMAVVGLNFAGNLVLIPVMGSAGALLSSFVVQAGAAIFYFVAVSRLSTKLMLDAAE